MGYRSVVAFDVFDDSEKVLDKIHLLYKKGYGFSEMFYKNKVDYAAVRNGNGYTHSECWGAINLLEDMFHVEQRSGNGKLYIGWNHDYIKWHSDSDGFFAETFGELQHHFGRVGEESHEDGEYNENIETDFESFFDVTYVEKTKEEMEEERVEYGEDGPEVYSGYFSLTWDDDIVNSPQLITKDKVFNPVELNNITINFLSEYEKKLAAKQKSKTKLYLKAIEYNQVGFLPDKFTAPQKKAVLKKLKEELEIYAINPVKILPVQLLKTLSKKMDLEGIDLQALFKNSVNGQADKFISMFERELLSHVVVKNKNNKTKTL